MLSNNIYQTYHGYDSILLLTLLMNVETAKKTNPYVVKLSLLDKEDTLNGYSQVMMIFTTTIINLICSVKITLSCNLIKYITLHFKICFSVFPKSYIIHNQ